MLKTSEGIAKFAMNKLKEEVFGKGLSAKLAGLAVRRRLRGLRKFFDPREYGGAPFLGLAKPVIKAHGSSDANAVKNAIRQASAYAETGVIAFLRQYKQRKRSRPAKMLKSLQRQYIISQKDGFHE